MRTSPDKLNNKKENNTIDLKTHFNPQEGTVVTMELIQKYAGTLAGLAVSSYKKAILTGGLNPQNITISHIFSHIQTGYAFFELNKRDLYHNYQIVQVKYKNLEVNTYDGKAISYHIGNLESSVVGEYSYEAFDTNLERLKTYLYYKWNEKISQLIAQTEQFDQPSHFSRELYSTGE